MTEMTHILIVDDDREIRDLLARFLGQHGYRVSVAEDGREMHRILDQSRIGLIVLDLMLPGEDGLTLCRNLRAKSDLPVIMLTAMGEETDRIVGLEMGADDYLAKPFNPRELLARIKAVLRRSGALSHPSDVTDKAVYVFAGWSLNTSTRELRSADSVLTPLTGGEYSLLVALLKHPQHVLSRDQLLDLARGRDAIPFDRSIDVQISRLRHKIEVEPSEPALIKTVRGGGYVLATSVDVFDKV
jgi:two-component system OmpR family response regulator